MKLFFQQKLNPKQHQYKNKEAYQYPFTALVFLAVQFTVFTVAKDHKHNKGNDKKNRKGKFPRTKHFVVF